ncbi:hypothetical protein [Rhizobium sp. Leaf262]|uniref:hypothetical protein n=1 Tax=Rhizobium sp. Leaf262 TaxID=1736312 RepID=UPI0007129725|nr:hypothetical protein [Rhizobium sp. Leaf262]KQO76111.1 hypothetical protein ASF29_08900 [Rhizobium sp. Leaf262]
MALDPSQGYPETSRKYASFAGNLEQQSFQFIKDLDAAMRSSYATNIVNIGQSIYPLLYVESTFDGGRYTLLTDKNTRYVHQNVGQIYDVMKAISHIPLGIFSIISGYEKDPKQGPWVPALQTYRAYIVSVQNTKSNISGLGREENILTDRMLASSLDFIDAVTTSVNFTYDEFAAYARGIGNEIFYCQKKAAKNQVDVMKGVLEGWKEMMGEDEWGKLYVIVGAVWTLTQENAHELIIKSLMNEDVRETHVVVSEAVPDLETAQALMGRIVGDRVMAELVFDWKANPAFAQDIYSLSTRRDLLSQAVEAVLKGRTPEQPSGGSAIGCPHLRS